MSETEKPTQGPTEAAPEPEPITFAEFLENVPAPSQLVNVTNLWAEQRGFEGRRYNELRFLQGQRQHIVALALRHKLPVVCRPSERPSGPVS
jgi:hypothetical protein